LLQGYRCTWCRRHISGGDRNGRTETTKTKEQMMDIEEHYGDFLTAEQITKLLDAREAMLNAADALHSVAAEMVGTIRRDNI
jgi:hypothetical protein